MRETSAAGQSIKLDQPTKDQSGESQDPPHPGSASAEVSVGRRRFSAAYKRRIVAEADRCGHGELGLLLRREGLYRGTVDAWRKTVQQDGVKGLEMGKRGHKPIPVNSLQAEVDKLTRELALERKARQRAEAIVDV